ncbi:hypothetical protein ACLK19_01035 [Escherichia coli]
MLIMNITRSDGKIFHLLQRFMMSKAMSLVMLEQGGQAFVRGIEYREISALNGSKKSKPVSCLAHYQQSSEAEKIAQSIILNGIRCQIQ